MINHKIKKARQQIYLQANYEKHAVLQSEIAHRMVDYLDEPSLNFETILDFGARNLELSHLLQQRFPKSVLHAYDPLWQYLTDDQAVIYLPDGKLPKCDFLISNCVFQDEVDWRKTAEKFYASLNPNGSLFFTSLGLGSFEVLIDAGLPFNPLPEIRELGDLLQAVGFIKNVLHVEKITLTYENLETLFADIRITGALPLRYSQGLFTPRWKQKVIDYLYAHCWQNNLYHIDVEVIYAHAQMPELASVKSEGNVAYFSLDHLKKTAPH